MSADSTISTYLTVSGGLAGRVMERGTSTAVFIISLDSCSGGGLVGRTAATAGSGWTRWLFQECCYVADCA